MKKLHPTVEAFRRAGRLINEWRDTLTYSGLSVGSAVLYTKTGHADLSVLMLSLAAFSRELARSTSWATSHDREILVGGFSPQEKPKIFSSNASAVACMAGAVGSLAYALSEQPHLFSPNYGFSASTTLFFLAGVYTKLGQGLSSVVKNYHEVMWDYPRKRDGGGTSETRRLLDGLNTAIKSFNPVKLPDTSFPARPIASQLIHPISAPNSQYI